jgi:hypothetical protein
MIVLLLLLLLQRRGEGSFGILAYGACGYTNEKGALPFPCTQVCTGLVWDTGNIEA